MSYNNNLISKPAPVPEIPYEAPRESFANKFSSVSAGISQEGGLATLTFKSIGYTKYIESLELVRDTLFKENSKELTRIKEDVFDAKLVLESLNKDIETLKSKSNLSVDQDNDEVTKLNNHLDDMLTSKQPISDYGKQVFDSYKKSIPNSEFLINAKPSTAIKTNLNIDVQKMLDVTNLDTSVYDEKTAETQAAKANADADADAASASVSASVSASAAPMETDPLPMMDAVTDAGTNAIGDDSINVPINDQSFTNPMNDISGAPMSAPYNMNDSVTDDVTGTYSTTPSGMFTNPSSRDMDMS